MTSSEIHARKYHYFAVGAIGTFMSTLDGSILNVALPTISNEFFASVGTVAWVVLAYSLTVVSLMMVFGAWTDRKGYRFAYQFAYLFFFLGSVGCVFSVSLHMLIVSRVIQAIGAAMFQAVGPGMVTLVFPDKERGKGIGLMVMVVAAGMVTGPPLAGFLLHLFSWQALFAINLPICLLGLFLATRVFKGFVVPAKLKRLRLSGAFSISFALFAGAMALSLIDEYPLSDFRIWGLVVISLIAVMQFLRSESNPETALIGLGIFRNRQFTMSLTAGLLTFVTLSGVLILLPFYLERVQGFEPKQVGMYLIILPLLMFLLAPISGRISDRIGFRFLTSFGMVILAVGLYLLSLLDMNSDTSFIIICLVFLGSGLSIFNTPNSSALMGSVTPEQRAITSGIISTSRNLGMSIGVALSTALFAYYEASNSATITDTKELFVSAYQPVLLIGFGIAVVSLPLSIFRSNR